MHVAFERGTVARTADNDDGTGHEPKVTIAWR
jgi:hypothetical protein